MPLISVLLLSSADSLLLSSVFCTACLLLTLCLFLSCETVATYAILLELGFEVITYRCLTGTGNYMVIRRQTDR
jgi:hypothetical protein